MSKVDELLSAIKVVDDATAESCAFVVCMPDFMPSQFTDNIKTVCCKCGTGIYHRPTAPKTPPKICVMCIAKEAPGEAVTKEASMIEALMVNPDAKKQAH